MVRAEPGDIVEVLWQDRPYEGRVLSEKDIPTNSGIEGCYWIEFSSADFEAIGIDNVYTNKPRNWVCFNASFVRKIVRNALECPSCEKGSVESGDYLCHHCRWGV
jgi:hypothetical protein